MAEKAGKIETIDVKRNPLAPTGQETSLKLQTSVPRRPMSAVRGQGGLSKEMNGVK